MSRLILDWTNRFPASIALSLLAFGLIVQPTLSRAELLQVKTGLTKIPIKVVVVTMFEHGELSGDRPGEFQFWVERLPLAKQLDFPLGPFPLRMNEAGVLGVCLGGGVANAAATVMALGLDSRFDLSQSYWLVAGIAGGDPEDSTLGSAVWANHVVDGDLLYEIDGREIPADWPYGMIPLGAERPAQTPQDTSTGWTLDTIHFALNADLARWAFKLTEDMDIPDTPGLQQGRAGYTGFPAALAPPRVMMGDTLSSSTYWHGALLNEWANDWVTLYAGENAEFVTTNMEDSGSLTALERLHEIGKVDLQRVMVLRAVSNFSMPPPDKGAAWSATAQYADKGLPALESAFSVGNKVVQTLLENWSEYSVSVPVSAHPAGSRAAGNVEPPAGG
ncbi:MAG: purine nucleoside permease [Pseudomonadaceae bacterium]|nr:purine nucleoside permease [Pseudomonadaceae bacterium]